MMNNDPQDAMGRFFVYRDGLKNHKTVAMSNMKMPRRAFGPHFLQFAKEPLCDDFLVYALDFVDLQLKMQMLKKGKEAAKELVGAELEHMIEETTRKLSETYTLVVMAHSDYTANLADQKFFELLLKMTNRVLESHFGPKVRDDMFAKKALANVFRSSNFNSEVHEGVWQAKSKEYHRPSKPISRSQMAKEDARAKRIKFQTAKHLLPLGVAMRTRSPLLTVKLPSPSTKQANYTERTHLSRDASLVLQQRCRDTTQDCIEGKCHLCGTPVVHAAPFRPLSRSSTPTRGHQRSSLSPHKHSPTTYLAPLPPRASTPSPMSVRVAHHITIDAFPSRASTPLPPALQAVLRSPEERRTTKEAKESPTDGSKEEEAEPHNTASKSTGTHKGRSGKMRTMMQRLDFDSSSLGSMQLFQCIADICEDFKIFELLRIKRENFRVFLTEIRSRHTQVNPWRNWTAAVGGCQMLYSMLTVGRAMAHLSVRETFCLLLAALAHGIEHPGIHEPFLISSEAELKALALGSSRAWWTQHRGMRCPTAEYRVNSLWGIGTQDKCNIFATLPQRVKKQMRELVQHMLGCADELIAKGEYGEELKTPLLPPQHMPHPACRSGSHQDEGTKDDAWNLLRSLKEADGGELSTPSSPWSSPQLSALQGGAFSLQPQEHGALGMAAKLTEVDSDREPLSPNQKRRLCTALFYVAYIGYPCRSHLIAKKVASTIREELWKQGDQERERAGLALCLTREAGPQSDLSHVELVVAPAVAHLVQAFPGMHQAVFNLSRYRATLLSGATGVMVEEPPPRDVDSYAKELLRMVEERQKTSAAALCDHAEVERVQRWKQNLQEVVETQDDKDSLANILAHDHKDTHDHKDSLANILAREEACRKGQLVTPRVELQEAIQPLTQRSEQEAHVIGVPGAFPLNIGKEAMAALQHTKPESEPVAEGATA